MIQDRNIAVDAEIDPSKIRQRIFSKEVNCALSTGAMYSRLAGKGLKLNDKLFTTLPAAYAAMVSGRNDAIWLSPDQQTLAAELVWSANLTHLMGMSPPGMMNLRSRIGHSAAFSPMMEVKGYGNWFDRIYWMHGTGSNTNVIGLLVSGSRNVFTNCHIGGPMNAAFEGALSTYELLKITGQENYFYKCTIGVDTIARSAANTLVHVDATTANRTVFDSCVFLSYASQTSPFMYKITGDSGDPGVNCVFKNCTFINSVFSGGGGQLLAAAFSQAGNNYTRLAGQCGFHGCTKVVSGLSTAIFADSFNTAAGTLGLAIAIGS